MHRYTTGTGVEPNSGADLKKNGSDSNNANAEQNSRARQGNALPPNFIEAGNDRGATVAATGA